MTPLSIMPLAMTLMTLAFIQRREYTYRLEWNTISIKDAISNMVGFEAYVILQVRDQSHQEVDDQSFDRLLRRFLQLKDQ